MGGSPAPFSDIGKRAKDVLTKDYSFDHMLTLSISRVTRMGLTAIGLRKGKIFFNNLYKRGNTTIDVKVDTDSNISTKVTVNDVLPSTTAAISFKLSCRKSGRDRLDMPYLHDDYAIYDTSILDPMLDMPYHDCAIDDSISLHPTPISAVSHPDMPYLHDDYAIYDSISLNPTTILGLSAATESKELTLGGEVGFDAASGSFSKFSAGIGLNKPDFSAALLLTRKFFSARKYFSAWKFFSTGKFYSVATESKELTLGGEVGFDVASGSFTKFSAGIGLNKPDSSAALLLTGKGQTLKASYVRSVSPVHSVAAELSCSLSVHENSFTIGSSHALDPLTVVKTRFSDGKLAMLWQREWSPKSLVTVSAEYDSGAIHTSALKCGLSLVL